MKFSPLNTSIVIIAQEHNPSILHPAFLTKVKIVPEDWKELEPPICTPAFSIVKYDNGLVFTVEANKLQVMDNNPSSNAEISEAPLRAKKYVQTLPHVRYASIGINFSGLVECTGWETYLVERFLKPGTWNSAPLKVGAIGIKMVYPLADARLNLSLDAGVVKSLQGQSERHGLLVSGNYHVDLDPAKPMESAVAAIEKFSLRATHFAETCATVLNLEG